MARISFRRAAAYLTLVCISLAAAAPASDEPLPRDPKNVYGQFDNGVKYIVRKNANPPGKVTLYFHVKTGALNETDQQNGLAHFIEHMAFNGSEHFKAGELIPLLNKMGMVFGADSNAHTNHYETVFKLTMPDTKPETIDRALTIFQDYGNGLTFSKEEVDQERNVILEESRAGKSAAERIEKATMKRMFADTRLAIHDVIGDEEQIKTFPRETFVDYWNNWYRPENMTLVVAGDMNPDDVIAQAKEKLSKITARTPSHQALKAGLKPTAAAKAFLFTDPEQVAGEVALVSLRPARPIVTTYSEYRIGVIEDLAQWIVERRIGDLIRKGGAPFRRATVDTSDFLHEAEISEVSAEGEPQDWNKMLDGVIAEVSRAIDHGFSTAELELAKTALLSGAERAVETEPTRDSTQIVAGLAGAVGLDRPILSAQQRLDLTKKVFESATVDELHQVFTDDFKTKNWLYSVNLPKSKEGLQLPTEDEILAAANAAWAKKTQALEEQKVAGTLLPAEPDFGKVASQDTDKDLKITTVTFENGVVMHHKFTDYKKDSIFVNIMLPGGAIEETAETKGLSDLASLMVRRAATSRLTSTQVRDFMTGKKVSVGGGMGFDALNINVNGSAKDLPVGMQLAYALLTDATLEQSAVDDWKKNELQELEANKTRPEGALRDAMENTLYAHDVRMIKNTPEQVNKLERSPAEAWFKRIVANAAIEVAVVGDISLEDATKLVARYVGSLPKRNNDFTSLDKLRKLDRPAGPFAKTVNYPSITPMAVVLAGYVGCNDLDPDRRPLQLASQIISDRMNERIREKERLVYSIGCQNAPSRGMPGTGMFFAAAPTDPKNADKLAETVLEMMKDFASKGCTDDELLTSKKQIANQLQTQMKEPAFWLSSLSELNYRHRPLSDLKLLPDIFQTFTAQQLKDTFNKYVKDDSVVRLEAIPKSASTTAPATEPAHEPAMAH